ncbi:hypothetical protein K3148_13415 [Qipengyuania aurantiaca]|uniref:Aspartate-semialdehyde dehydrogenase n=1 Tax=Qipengyuania aurantiaca TaxID=2867233 RepID=A0ABX8ZRG4_9SPHN|nr:hypothetical protein [Qipengyuania aurantiaca]QZD89778.1 hypothetical protein K3148_13415 [Qipengyuania aurantiaca]
MMRTAFLLALPFALAACGSEPEDQSPAPQTDVAETELPPANPTVEEFGDTKIVVDANGVGAKGEETLRFGSARSEVDASLVEAFGEQGEQSANGECGAGPMEFSTYGPLQVNYQDDRLVGWNLQAGEGMATSDGVRPGTTPYALLKEERTVREMESTLPGEFHYTSADYGTIGGFAEDGRIVSLHAGVNCFFR